MVWKVDLAICAWRLGPLLQSECLRKLAQKEKKLVHIETGDMSTTEQKGGEQVESLQCL